MISSYNIYYWLDKYGGYDICVYFGLFFVKSLITSKNPLIGVISIFTFIYNTFNLLKKISKVSSLFEIYSSGHSCLNWFQATKKKYCLETIKYYILVHIVVVYVYSMLKESKMCIYYLRVCTKM